MGYAQTIIVLSPIHVKYTLNPKYASKLGLVKVPITDVCLLVFFFKPHRLNSCVLFLLLSIFKECCASLLRY